MCRNIKKLVASSYQRVYLDILKSTNSYLEVFQMHLALSSNSKPNHISAIKRSIVNYFILKTLQNVTTFAKDHKIKKG